MATKYHHISLSDIFSDCQNSFIDESPSFFSLLSEHFDLNEFIPPEFPTAFYLSIGRKRLYPYSFTTKDAVPFSVSSGKIMRHNHTSADS